MKTTENTNDKKSEARNSKYETISKFEFSKFQTV